MKQVRAFRDSTRLTANPASKTNSMHLVATATSDADVASAAQYFSALKLTRRNIVREVTQGPNTRIEVMLYAYAGPGTEPIEDRLIEVPETFERHELRDPTVVRDMVSLAAYVGSRPPSAPAITKRRNTP